jgi:hypothetical protein
MLLFKSLIFISPSNAGNVLDTVKNKLFAEVEESSE